MLDHTRAPLAIDLAFRARVETALEEYQTKQASFSKRTAKFSSWRITEDESALILSGENVEDEAFELVPIGTYMSELEDWAWAWANDSFGLEARRASERLKALAEVTSFENFVVPSFGASLDEVGEICALSLNYFAALAVFKVKDSQPWAYYLVK